MIRPKKKHATEYSETSFWNKISNNANKTKAKNNLTKWFGPVNETDLQFIEKYNTYPL